MHALLEINRRLWPLITLTLIVAITVLSLTPLPELPLPELAHTDKLHHFVAYAALALPVALARPRGWPWWIAGFVAWGGAIELVQPYVNRHGAWADVLANASGTAMGVLVGSLLRRVARPA